MQLAIDVAGFDAGEADQLRRAMGAKRSSANGWSSCRTGCTTGWPSAASPASWPTTIYEQAARLRQLRVPRDRTR